MRSAALCVIVSTLVAAAMCPRSGRAAKTGATCRPATRSQVKWLINTGNLAARWPPAASLTGQNRSDAAAANRSARCWSAAATPNTISRLQMIDGGAVAVLVMPAGDGGHRCCRGGTTFSLGFVRLRHGFNNLYPIIQPFPDWRAFVEVAGPSPKSGIQGLSPKSCLQGPSSPPTPKPAADDVTDSEGCVVEVEEHTSRSCPPPNNRAADRHHCHQRHQRHQRIVNAVDVFLDDLGRILWVLDTGDADEDACNSDTVLSPPKFLAIDVHTNQTISVVSLSRMWKPGVSCFQYIVAVYPDTFNDGNDDDNATTTKGAPAATWPLVVISDSGANRVLAYSHSVDRFTEIALPQQDEEQNVDDKQEDGAPAAGNRSSCSTPKPSSRPRAWPVPRARDALYMVPLYPRPGHSTLLVTYRGRPHVYKLRLQPSRAAMDVSGSNTFRVPPVPVTATLSKIGRKPCVMVMLGSDRRRTDRGDEFDGGGTTVYFRMADANDVWSWATEKCGISTGIIDPRHFRLVRRGRTCRFPVAVSAAPATGSGCGKGGGAADESKSASGVRQVVWVLETNAADHFAGAADRMGANAKLQPIEAISGGADDSTVMRLKPSPRMRPSDCRRRNATEPRRNRCFPAH